MPGLDFPNLGDDQIEGFVPAGLAKARRGADERSGEPIRVVRLHVALDALGAEPSLIEGKLQPRLEADDLILRDLQLDAALHAAKAAVRLDQTLHRRLVLPTLDRRVGDVGAVGANVIGDGQVQTGQEGLLFFEAVAWARAMPTRRPRGDSWFHAGCRSSPAR